MDRTDRRLELRAAALLGLLSSSFSTLIVSLAAARIGRDVAVDWMVVGSLLLRDAGLQAEPGWGGIAAGLAVHQSADFAWAVVFFGLLRRWTAGLPPRRILLLALPWAFFTSALEWCLLVPRLPFRQPVFTLAQAYWLGFAVHGLSSMLYALFPWLRDRLAHRGPSPHRRFAAAWGGLALAMLAGTGLLAALGAGGHDLAHAGRQAAWDRDYMRRMADHHAQGIEIATLAAERAADPHLRALARLMIAAQQGEVRVFTAWWRSWFAEPPVLVCSAQERAAMPGMLDPGRMAALRRMRGDGFDAAFVDAMSYHHRGAIAMADEAMHRAGDPRLRVMAHAIRHEQRGEIALLQGRHGRDAVALADRALVAPFGRHPMDQP
jgi:uncharacterized protein (DUF305 family)